MKHKNMLLSALLLIAGTAAGYGQLGRQFPSERRIVKDPRTGMDIIFLTSKSGMFDHKTYQTHSQWTADGKWCIFDSKNRAEGNAIAVNEDSGEMIQVTEGGYTGKILISRKEMKMFFLRNQKDPKARRKGKSQTAEGPKNLTKEIVETDLAALFADSHAGKMKKAGHYERVVATIPPEYGIGGGDIALDASERTVYFRTGREYAAQHLPEGTKIEPNFGPRHMGAGPTGIAAVNLETGAITNVITVGFQIGHVQTNPWKPGEIIFCWETGGKAPQRTWMVQADGTGLQPIYEETKYDWVTHEAVIGRDEIAIAILGHRPMQPVNKDKFVYDAANPGQEPGWGPSGTRAKATGLAVVNLRTHALSLEGQIPYGSGFWHVHGSADGHWVVGDNFRRELWLIDRHTGERILLTAGHKETAQDHIHPTFSPDGTKINFQSAMLSEDGRSMNICVIRLPQSLLDRYKH